mgnify:CR=1 FL=1
MNTFTEQNFHFFFDSLVSPACVINRELIIHKTNDEFLYLADISRGYLDKKIALYNCLEIGLFDENSDEYLDKVFSGEICLSRTYTKACNSKGIPLSLLVSIIPDSNRQSCFATLL